MRLVVQVVVSLRRGRLGLVLAASVLLATPGRVTAQSGSIYVANQEPATVTVIDLATHRVTATIDLQALGFSANAKPHHTAVEPDGSHWYVSLIGDGRVLKFDRTNRLVGAVVFEAPGLLAIHPTADLLLVGRSMAAVNPPQRIGVIRRSDMSIEELPVFFPRPHAMLVDPRGRFAYTASLAVNQLAAIDLETEELSLMEVAGPPHTFVQFASSPDGTRLVVTAQMSNKVFVYDSSDPTHLSLVTVIDVDAWPWHPTFTPDGQFVFVGNQEANTVTVIATTDWSIVRVIEGEGLAEPHGIAVSPDGRYVFVSNRNLKETYRPTEGDDSRKVGTVVVIRVSDGQIEDVVEVGRYAAGMSTVPPAP